MSKERQSHKRSRSESMFSITMKRLIKNKAAMLGVIVLLIEAVLAILAPYICRYSFDAVDPVHKFMRPCMEHLFGTDNLGRDLLSRVLYGARYSLTIGVAATLLGTLLGMVIGGISGYFGGKTDFLLMRFLDVITSIPSMLLTIIIVAVMGTGVVPTLCALAVGRIAGSARMFRAQCLAIRGQEYVEACQSIGCSHFSILLRHITPNAISPLIVSTTLGMAGAVTACAGLSFIGLGVQMPIPEWGALLSAGRTYLRQYAYLSVFPGLAIMLTVFSLNMVGDGLRDALDPKLKN